jgi:hypothetical protein
LHSGKISPSAGAQNRVSADVIKLTDNSKVKNLGVDVKNM